MNTQWDQVSETLVNLKTSVNEQKNFGVGHLLPFPPVLQVKTILFTNPLPGRFF